MENNRIQILKEILLDLHHGASPESVQERFNQHFKGVSALEISMMEHELMSSEDGVTFEDVMSLCNVHANLFKGAIADVEVADADQEGHPVYVFKQENLALRSAILRIRRIIENISKPEKMCIRDRLRLFQDLSRSPSITSLPDDITRFLFYCGSILSKKPNSVNTNFHQNYKKPNIILKNAFHQNLEKPGITIMLSK